VAYAFSSLFKLTNIKLRVHTQQYCYVFPRKLTPWRDSNPVLMLLRRMRYSLSHDVIGFWNIFAENEVFFSQNTHSYCHWCLWLVSRWDLLCKYLLCKYLNCFLDQAWQYVPRWVPWPCDCSAMWRQSVLEDALKLPEKNSSTVNLPWVKADTKKHFRKSRKDIQVCLKPVFFVKVWQTEYFTPCTLQNKAF
jgi:hypothetical protein